MKYNLIAFTGRKNSGKDTCANYLCDNYRFFKLYFAHKLKKICSEVFDLDIKYFEDPILKELPMEELNGYTPRFVLQHIGTEGFRFINPNVWAKYVEKQIISLNQKLSDMYCEPRENRIAISDLRFFEEYEMIKRRKGILVHIERPDLITKDNHESEKYFDELKKLADICLVNNGIPSLLDQFDIKVCYLLED